MAGVPVERRAVLLDRRELVPDQRRLEEAGEVVAREGIRGREARGLQEEEADLVAVLFREPALAHGAQAETVGQTEGTPGVLGEAGADLPEASDRALEIRAARRLGLVAGLEEDEVDPGVEEQGLGGQRDPEAPGRRPKALEVAGGGAFPAGSDGEPRGPAQRAKIEGRALERAVVGGQGGLDVPVRLVEGSEQAVEGRVLGREGDRGQELPLRPPHEVEVGRVGTTAGEGEQAAPEERVGLRETGGRAGEFSGRLRGGFDAPALEVRLDALEDAVLLRFRRAPPALGEARGEGGRIRGKPAAARLEDEDREGRGPAEAGEPWHAGHPNPGLPGVHGAGRAQVAPLPLPG